VRVDSLGKPHLARRGRGVGIAFNMSHSGPIAVYAFAPAAAVGIDVQTVPARAIDEVAIARRALGTEESFRLAGLEPAARGHHFLQAWTRREAVLKCLGIGLGHSPNPDIDRTGAEAEVCVEDLELGVVAAGALACSVRPHQVLQWTWHA
jgi:4'-phosphopantetheinyl transferase